MKATVKKNINKEYLLTLLKKYKKMKNLNFMNFN